MRAFKLILWLTFGLIVLLGIGLIGFVMSFDPNRYRSTLGEAITQATGRAVTLDGDLSLSIWPNIAIRAEEVSLANAEGFTATPMLTATAIEATVQLQPLLQREVRIDGVVVYSPVLEFQAHKAVAQAGSTAPNNWADLQEHFAKLAQQERTADKRVELVMREMTIRNASIHYRTDSTAPPTYALTGLDQKIGFDDAGNIQLSAAGNWHAAEITQSFQLTTSIQLAESGARLSDFEFATQANLGSEGNTSLTLMADLLQFAPDYGTVTANPLQLLVDGDTVDMTLTGSNLRDTPVFTGTLKARAADLPGLLQAAAMPAPGGVPAEDFGPLDITSQFTIAQATDGLTLKLARLNAHLPQFDLTRIGASRPAPLTLAGELEWLPATGRTPARLKYQSAAIDSFGIGATLSGTTHVRDSGAQTDSRLTVRSFSPKQVLTNFGLEILTRDPGVLSQASLATQLQLTEQATTLKELQLQLDTSTITGSLELQSAALPTWRFDLDVDALDATRYLPPDSAPGNPDEPAAQLGDLVLPTAQLHRYDLAGSIAVKQLKLYGLNFANTSTQLQLGNGSASLSRLVAELYGGRFDGAIEVDQQGSDPAAFSLQGKLTDVVLDQLLLATVGTTSFAGTGSVSVDLTGKGPTTVDATRSAAGNFAMRLRDGSFTGVNLGHQLCVLFNRLRNKPPPPAIDNTSTHFDQFSASALVTDGVARTNDLAASNSYLKLTGEGRARLARQSINYDLDIELIGPIDEPNCETLTPYIGSKIPVKLTGTFTDPVVRPDFGKLAKREIRRRVEEKLTEKLLDLLGENKAPTEEPAEPPNGEPVP